MPPRERKALGEASYYGCRKAYWKIDSEPDGNGSQRPLGICLTAELDADDLEAAEDAALDVGLRFSQVLAAYSGSPLPQPKLKRVGRIGTSEGLYEQFDYYYLEGPDSLPRVKLGADYLERLLSWFGSLDDSTANRLELAARWYGISVGAQDPLDGYLAIWIGLESVGPAFGTRMHPNGSKAYCHVCRNEQGIDRDRGKSGIVHAIMATAPELFEDHTFEELKEIRDFIAHGIKPAGALRIEAKSSLADLQLALQFSLINTVRPESSAHILGKAILPRNYDVYPEGRASVRSQVELIYHRPFYGEWLDVSRNDDQQQSRVESDGNYVWGAQTRIKAGGKFESDSPELVREYVIFDRMGRSWQNLDNDDSEFPSIPVVSWRVTNISLAWQRYLSSEEVGSET